MYVLYYTRRESAANENRHTTCALCVPLKLVMGSRSKVDLLYSAAAVCC